MVRRVASRILGLTSLGGSRPARSTGCRRAVSFLLALLCLVAVLGAPRQAAAARAELVTIGTGSEIFARYGHSAVCIGEAARGEGAPEARCYDFGIQDDAPGGALRLVWDTYRGRPRFLPIAVTRSILIAAFTAQGRTIWTQDLPMSEAQVASLAASLEASVAAHASYAYHPYYYNCTTPIRDAIDKASGGALRPVAAAPEAPTFRAATEGGFSGSALELTGLALFLGNPADRPMTAWEALFLPANLRDAVQARMGAAPTVVYERREMFVPKTSTNAGRIVLALLGALMAGAALWTVRRSPGRVGYVLVALGLVLGLVGLAVDGVALGAAYPEVTRNWVLLVLLPTDLVLAVAPRKALRYVQARLGAVGLLALLSAVGLVAQPLVLVCAFVAMPLAAAWPAVRRLSPAPPQPA